MGMNYLQPCISWCHSHPLTFSVILFVLASLVSVYSAEIKQFLRHWPQTRVTLLFLRRNKAKHELHLLLRLHDNVYELLLYFIWSLVSPVGTALVFTLAIAAGSWMRTRDFNDRILWPLLGGFLVGKAIEVRQTASRLYDFDASVKKLEKKVQDFDSLPERPPK
jgi:hypothetical protein